MFWSSAEQVAQARHLTEQAIARDPEYGTALAWGAYCCLGLVHANLSGDPAADRRKAIDFARRALAVADNDPGILVNAALPLAYFGEDIGAMIALVDRALALNPSFAHGWFVNGALHLWAGDPDAAINHSEVSLRLSPRARIGAALCLIGGAHFFSRRFDPAVPTLLLAIQDDSSYPQPYRYLAACYALTDRLDDAKEVIARLRAITPKLIPDASYLRKADHRELYLSGLRLAAGETT
jgi:tetratricopeptide (TPR) repeat protein